MNILITGATGGIGKTIANILSKEHTIFATGRNIDALKKYGATPLHRMTFITKLKVKNRC